MRRPTPTRNSWPPLRPRCSKPPRSWNSSGQPPCGIASRTSARRRDVVRLAPPPAPRRKAPAAGQRPRHEQAAAGKTSRPSTDLVVYTFVIIDRSLFISMHEVDRVGGSRDGLVPAQQIVATTRAHDGKQARSGGFLAAPGHWSGFRRL